MTETRINSAEFSGGSIRDVIDFWAEESPSKIFLIDPDTDSSLTYKQVQSACQSVASRLQAEGVGKGASVGYAMSNGLDAAQVILGCLYGGYLTTAINLVSGSSAISYVLEHSEVSVIFVQEYTKTSIEESAVQAGLDLNIIQVNPQLFSETGGRMSSLAGSDPGLLMYTSGTTGVPKGVVHTHTSLIAGGANTANAHGLDESDRALCVLPLYHINGLCVTLIGTLVSGGSVVMPGRFSVSTFWHQIGLYSCSWFSVVPTQISYLLHDAAISSGTQHLPSSIRFGRSASAPLAPDVQQAFESRFQIPIIETMGLTETAAQILANPIDGQRKIGSPGIAFGNEVMIADENQQSCAVGTEGELLVRGPNVMLGYLKNPEITAQAITPEGWFRTGDLGKMDEDGYVFITGRLKEIIIKGGENIAPREIDEALYTHADVIEAAAFARDCLQYGQTIEAAVVVKPGSGLNAEALMELCQHKLGVFKSPDKIHFFGELPKGPSGKIQRLKLAEMTAAEVVADSVVTHHPS